MDKYIVEIDGKNICLDLDGKSKLALSVKSDNGYAVFCTEIPLTHYTAPDLEQAKKTAYYDGYNTGYQAGREDLNRVMSDMEQVRIEAFQEGKKQAKVQAELDVCHDIEKVAKENYKAGLSDAWEAARKICTNWVLPDSVLSKIFGIDKTIDDIMKENTASEAIEKIRQYEEKQEEQIQVGDEVVGTYTGEEETEPFVIIRKIPEIYPAYYFGIYSKSGEFCQGGLKLKKTGRHFPEIAEVLEKMKESE